MKIQLILFIVVVLVLSGCSDEDNNVEEKDELKIVDYTVYTQAYSYNTGWKSFSEGCNVSSLPEIAEASDTYSADQFSKSRYLINGTVKNIAGHKISTILITLYFYASNNTIITTDQVNNLLGLEDGETWEFGFEYAYDEHFNNIDHVEISPGPEKIDFYPVDHVEK